MSADVDPSKFLKVRIVPRPIYPAPSRSDLQWCINPTRRAVFLSVLVLLLFLPQSCPRTVDTLNLPQGAAVQKEDTTDMKIAWRYKNLPKVSVSAFCCWRAQPEVWGNGAQEEKENKKMHV